MNVVLLVIDSLRSDHVGINGYGTDTTPNIDEIARKGVIFPNCIATIASTAPSISSMLTGLYPHSHGVREMYTHKIHSSITTLQSILKSHGYKTAGHAIELKDIGLEMGFDSFNPLSWRIINKIRRNAIKSVKWNHNENPAETLTKFAIKKINSFKNGKFFLYLHYIGLHWPYDVPAPYGEMFDPDYKGKHDFISLGSYSRGDLIFNNSLPKREIQHAIAHYDGALKYMDSQVGKIADHLKKMEIYGNTLVIITSDHGESLGEHNVYFSHGHYAYDVELNVPLVFSKKILHEQRYDGQVQGIDIMPTVLDVLGIPLIEKIDGVSLTKLAKGEIKRKFVYAESGRSYFKQNKRTYIEGVMGKWRMIRTEEWKLICIPHPENDIFELYNIKKDPYEKVNLIGKHTEIEDILKKHLFDWIKDKKPEKEMDLTEKSKKLLKDLGYMD